MSPRYGGLPSKSKPDRFCSQIVSVISFSNLRRKHYSQPVVLVHTLSLIQPELLLRSPTFQRFLHSSPRTPPYLSIHIGTTHPDAKDQVEQGGSTKQVTLLSVTATRASISNQKASRGHSSLHLVSLYRIKHKLIALAFKAPRHPLYHLPLTSCTIRGLFHTFAGSVRGLFHTFGGSMTPISIVHFLN